MLGCRESQVVWAYGQTRKVESFEERRYGYDAVSRDQPLGPVEPRDATLPFRRFADENLAVLGYILFEFMEAKWNT